MKRLLYALLLLPVVFCPYTVESQVILPDGFSMKKAFMGIDAIAMDFDPAGNIFVSDKNGKIFLFDGTTLRQIGSLAVNNQYESGLMGIALDPEFASNGYVYLYYTLPGATQNRLSRFVFHDGHLHTEEEEVLLDLDQMNHPLHNGGCIKFGPDGKLYIAIGDGVNGEMAQSHTSLLGKMLRLNPDGSIPTDNPFYFQNEGKYRSIYAYGLRNPFTFSFNEEGRLFLNDVGSGGYEEINDVLRGKNYGWPLVEGKLADNPNVLPPENYVDPIYAYSHAHGCAVTGSAFCPKDNLKFPEQYRGKYFFGDFCDTKINMLDPVTHEVDTFMRHAQAISISVNDAGDLYYIIFTGGSHGEIWKISYEGDGSPRVTTGPKPLTLPVGEPAAFEVSATGSGTLLYQWLKNGEEITGETASALLLENVSLSDSGSYYSCRIENDLGVVESDSARLTVTQRSRPFIVIDMSGNNSHYTAGDTIIVKGLATDGEEGTLPGEALSWRVDFHHDLHAHPVISELGGTDSIGFIIPTVGETSSNVWYQVHLTATNNIGLTSASSAAIHPRVATITVESSDGQALNFSLDGKKLVTPFTFTAVEGMTRNLGTSTQYNHDSLFRFTSWNGQHEDRSFTFDVGERDTTFVVHFSKAPAGEGDGLAASYYNGSMTFEGEADLQRIDDRIDFNWETASPGPGISGNFSALWQGFIRIPFDGNFTFYTKAKGGVQVRVDDSVVIDQLGNPVLKEFKGTKTLTGGKIYPVMVLYNSPSDKGEITFHWWSEELEECIVPSQVLFHQYYYPTVDLNMTTDGQFGIGDTVVATGEASDYRGNPIAENRLTWSVDYVTPDTTIHLSTISGESELSYSLSDNLTYVDGAYLQVSLTAEDSTGFIATASRILPPELFVVHVGADVAGVNVAVNTHPFNVPGDLMAINGSTLDITVVDSVFVRDSTLYVFVNWKTGTSIHLTISGDTTIYLGFDEIPLNHGNGIRGNYFSEAKTFEDNPDSTRVDKQINFFLQDLAPNARVHWRGWITPPLDGDYFITGASTGRLDIALHRELFSIENGVVLIDRNPVYMRKGGFYPIEVYYDRGTSEGGASLMWRSASMPAHIIPQAQLYVDLPDVVGIETSLASASLYPNPVGSSLTIDLHGFPAQPVRYLIYNVFGEVVFTSASSPAERFRTDILDLTGLTTGIYFLEIIHGQQATVTKIVKK